MGVTCHDFLNSATQLVEGSSEIDHRNAASRAHYAAYHACEAVSHLCPKIDTKGIGHHEALVLRFKKYPKEKPNHKVADKIAWLLNQTRTIRARADYDVGDDFRKGLADTQVGHAKRIITLVAEFSAAEKAKSST